MKILAGSKVSMTSAVTGSVDIEDLSPVTRQTFTISCTIGLRAAVTGGIGLIAQNGVATVTLHIRGETFGGAFESGATISTIILIDHWHWMVEPFEKFRNVIFFKILKISSMEYSKYV